MHGTRLFTRLVPVLLTMFAIGCTAKPVAGGSSDPALGNLAWLSGTWVGDNSVSFTEEHWTQPHGGTMLGLNRSIHDGKTVFFEYLRIETQADGVVYLASPKGRHPPTPFKMVEHTPDATFQRGRVVFENPQHDFPQRIAYQREGDVMHAQVEGMRNGRLAVEGWTWRLVK